MPSTRYRPGQVTIASFQPGRDRSMSEFAIEVQGLETLIEHWQAVAAVVGPLSYRVVDFYGQLTKENGRRFAPFDTGAMHDSIHTGDAGGGGPEGGPTPDGPPVIWGDGWTIDIGPTTYYARWVHNGTVLMAPRPFMVRAIDITERPFVASMTDVALVADQLGNFGKAATDPGVQSLIGQVRGLLYTSAKAMGDVNALVGRNIFGGWRSSLYFAARGLGDVNAIMSATVSSRVSRRMSGRVTGRLAGVGSATLSWGATYSDFPGGSGGHRIYQRVAGRVLSGGIFGGGRGGSQVGLTRFGRLP